MLFAFLLLLLSSFFVAPFPSCFNHFPLSDPDGDTLSFLIQATPSRGQLYDSSGRVLYAGDMCSTDTVLYKTVAGAGGGHSTHSTHTHTTHTIGLLSPMLN